MGAAVSSARSLRVLELTQRYPPAVGGVERHVADLARGLERRGVSVEVATTDLVRDVGRDRLADTPSGTGQVRRHRAFVVTSRLRGLGVISPGLLTDSLRAPVDVIHAHAFGYPTTWIGRIAQRLRRLPLVVTPHAYPGPPPSGLAGYDRWVARATLGGADRIVALTETEADWLARLGVDRGRITVIPNGIDLSEFESISSRRRPHDHPIVLYVGRLLAPQKGLDTLVEAFAFLPPSLRAELRVVGPDWGAASTVRTIAQSRGVGDRLTLTGPVSREALLAEYASADVFVLPSRFEPFGIVLLEAMAAGLPIVASRVGGIPDVVGDWENALLVPAGRPRPLAEAMRVLLTDAELRRRFSDRGRHRVERFAWPALLPRFVALFEELVGARRPAGAL